MASTRQIENLERKHRENPEGLTFAPLANAYRNSGQPERAIEILTLGLEHHPQHAPARIVLGRCHVDLGDDAAAEVAFTKVLELDQENVVALKALADITERSGRYDESIRWLDYLLEVDRNNEEARDQLARVTEAAEAQPPEAAPEVAEEPEIAGTDAESTAEVGSGTIGGVSPFEPPPQPESLHTGFEVPVTEEDSTPEPVDNPWAHPLAGPGSDTTAPVEQESDDPAPWAAQTEAGRPSRETPDDAPTAWEPPVPSEDAVDGLEAIEFDGSLPDGPGGDKEVEGLESAVFEGPGDTAGGSAGLDGLQSSEFEAPTASDVPDEVDGLQPPGDYIPDSGLALERGEDIVLNPAQENEFQAGSAAENLSPEAAEETEYQASDAADELVLRPSGVSEYQTPPDLASLDVPSSDDESQAGGVEGPEDKVGEEEEDQSLSPSASNQDDSAWPPAPPDIPEPEAAAATDEPVDEGVAPEPVSSWFAPANEEPIPTPMSQPDGTSESSESDEPKGIPPFEEEQPLPSAWSPAPSGDDPPSPVASDHAESVMEPDPEEPDTAARAETDNEDVMDVEQSGWASTGLEVPDAVVEPSGEPAPSETDIDDVMDAARGGWDSTGLEVADAAVESSGEHPEAEADTDAYGSSEPDMVATETMAELYLSQGHRQEALDVYRILWQEAPDDQRLREKVDALQTELDSVAAAESASEAAADSAWDEVTVSETPVSTTDYAASKTGGQPTRSFFKGLLASRPTSAAPPADEEPVEGAEESTRVGEPTRPAEDRLSLSAVFGEEASPVPPAVGRTDQPEGEGTGEGFSFDSFFGGERGDPGRRRPAARRPRSDEDEADLDQFHAWLQGLKG